MQGASWPSYSALCFAVNNVADESHRLAQWVKINAIK